MSETFFHRTVMAHFESLKKKPDQVQVAFYGGNFTGMAKQDQNRLLGYARPFLEAGSVHAVRISTRPDFLDQEELELLRNSGVRIVEIGAQSLVDDVLKHAHRGHLARDVETAVKRLKENGFEVGIHLMAGLPGDSPEGFGLSVDRTIALQPNTVRLHPTLVFEGTLLAQDYINGRYKPLTLEEAVGLCKSALLKFAAAGIPVIRVGLQMTREMQKRQAILAGPCHPALRLLVESSIFYDRAVSLLESQDFRGKTAVFSVFSKEQSSLRGPGNENLRLLQKRFGLSTVRISPVPIQDAGTLYVHCDA